MTNENVTPSLNCYGSVTRRHMPASDVAAVLPANFHVHSVWPDRPIKIIVESKVGEGGTVGTDLVAKLASDGELIARPTTSHARP
ncbi:MAG: hypothetical protein RL300_1515 [Pseudomonadota bacterium]|jgi:hypothetical protein